MNPYSLFKGFDQWFNSSREILKDCFTPVAQQEYNTLEDFAFAVFEVFFDLQPQSI